jgi:hypothetical protein
MRPRQLRMAAISWSRVAADRLPRSAFMLDQAPSVSCHSACNVGQAGASTPDIGKEGLLRLVGWAEKLRARDHAVGAGQGRPRGTRGPAAGRVWPSALG